MSNSLGDTETPAHFFKVILPSTLEDKKLSIPEKFARKLWGEHSAVATLRVPNGLVWQVGLTRDGRKIWFHDHWHDFVEYHSINIGYFVVFKYVKNSTFDVLIFDMTACEIHYPYNGGEIGKKKNMSLKERPCPAPIEISKFKQGYESQSKNCKMEELIETNESTNDEIESELFALLKDMGIFFTENFRHLSTEETHRAIKIVRLVKPKNPTFMVILRSSYVNHRQLYAPGKFANKYLSRDVKFIKLRVPNGKECVINIHCGRTGGFNLTKGWAEFSKNNNIEVGDICFFELIRRKDFLLEVSVFHATIG